MLLIFDKNEKLQAILEQDTSLSYSKPQGTAFFLSSSYPTPEGQSAQESACPYFNAVHSEKLNQENTFSFSIPADRPESSFVKEGAFVAFRDQDLYWQMFEIQKVTDIHNESGVIRQVYAEHVFYELLYDIIEDVRPYNTTAQAALTAALANTRWQPGIVYDFGTNSVNFYYESVLSALQKIVNTWGGELRFRIEITENVITGRYVDILNRRGEDTGKSFEYTKDIVEIQREVDISSVYTAAYGRGKGIEVETTAGDESYGRRLTFADVVWSTANGDPVDKPAGQEWVGDPDALAQWGRNGRHRFGIYLDSDETDPAALLQKTWEYVQENKNPLITYSLSVLDLERLSGYNHEAVRLGDTVYVRDKDLNLDVVARVIEIDRDLLLPENTKIVLGNFRPDITDDAIIQAQINRTVSDRQGIWDRATAFGANGKLPTEWLEGIINTLQNQVNAGAGTVTITDDNGILIVDNAENPTAALRLLGGVFAIANTKNPDGTWNWRTFGTGSGFVADEINSGKIRTALVNIFGDTNFYWDADGIKAVNPNNGNMWIKFNKDGLFFTKDNGATYDFSISWAGLFLGTISREQLAQDIKDALDAAENANAYTDQQLNNFVTAIYNPRIQDLQSQIDGNITSWFYDYEPTLSNAPANSWATDADKNKHLGDLFYWVSKGYAYRFANVSGVYQWIRISDVDVTLALQQAANAQDTADSKRRVFTTTPTPPYDIGDLWAQGPGGELMRCKVAKSAGQTYSPSDWEKASKYTDDAVANQALENANNAQIAADAANAMLADIALDSKLTPVEKQSTKKEWDIIVAEKPTIEAQANNYGITTEKNNYINAYNALSAYITPLLADLATTSDINGTEFRNKFKDYYDKKTILLKAITDKAKALTDQAVKTGVKYNNVEISPIVGVKATHATGEYTQLDGEGLRHFYPNPIYTETPTGVPNTEGFESGTLPSNFSGSGISVTTAAKRSGNYGLQMNVSSSNVYVRATFTVTQDNTTVSFWYKLSASGVGDLAVALDGVYKGTLSATTWTQFTITGVSKGKHELTIHWYDNGSTGYAYFDDFVFEQNPVTRTISGYNPSIGQNHVYGIYLGEASSSFRRINSDSPSGVPNTWIQLPECFRGKNLDIFLSLKSFDWTAQVRGICLKLLEIDNTIPAFCVSAYVQSSIIKYNSVYGLYYEYFIAGIDFTYMVIVRD